MIDPEDKATEPEGFQEWKEVFQRNNMDNLYKLESILLSRKPPLSTEEIDDVWYYICRACRSAQLMKESTRVRGRRTKAPLRASLYWRPRNPRFARVGRFRFPVRQRYGRSFKATRSDTLIYEITLIVKSACKRLPISLENGYKTIPDGVRINQLNEIIVDLLTLTLPEDQWTKDLQKKDKKDRTKAIENRLDYLSKRSFSLY